MKRILLIAMLAAILCPATADAGLVFRNGPFDGHRLERVKQGVGNAVRTVGGVARDAGGRLLGRR